MLSWPCQYWYLTSDLWPLTSDLWPDLCRVSVSISDQPYLVGIRAGSVLRAEEKQEVSCSALLQSYSQHLAFLWRVNGLQVNKLRETLGSLSHFCLTKVRQTDYKYWNMLLQVWEDLSPQVVSDQVVSSFSYSPALSDQSLECCVVNSTHQQSSITTFSVTSNPTLVKLNRLEVSHNKILWVPFDAKQMGLSGKKNSFGEKSEGSSRNIYKYFGEYFYQSSHTRENKRKFNAEMLKPVTMALISESPSSKSVQCIVISLLIFVIKLHWTENVFIIFPTKKKSKKFCTEWKAECYFYW